MSNNQRRNGPKFNPGMHGMRGGGEKAKDFKGTIAKLFRYLKPYYFKISCSNYFCSCFNSIFNCWTKDL